MACLADGQVHDFVAGALDGDALAEVNQHLDSCAHCRELVGSARRALSGDDADAGDSMSLPAGTQIGRFEIAGLLGRGAMGVVYAARDPRLDRPVALKLLRPDQDDARDGDASLLAEAKAMARVSHPNVVAVYEVDTLAAPDDELYVAMELVNGETLRAQIERGPRPWRTVVAQLVGAGRGLATAHRAGVLHRDFKPENVLVGVDGRARVTDFGLARAGAHAGDLAAAGVLGRTLTSLAGTPAYMAPELFAGQPASARSNQWSFCITLFEALTGARPFDGPDLDALAAATRAGQLRWPDAPPVPPAVRRAVARGLTPADADRWPSMDLLVAALEATLRRRRRWWAIGGAGAGAVAAASIAATLSLGRGARDPCADAAAPMATVWSPARATSLEGRFSEAAAEDAYRLTTAALDHYANAWSAMRVEACKATAVRHEQSPALLDRRILCLDQRLGAVRARVDQLANADASGLIDAPRAVAELPGIEACADVATLGAVTPPPDNPEARAEIDALRGELDRARAAGDAGDLGRARKTAEAAVTRARALGYGPLLAAALQIQSSTLIDAGDVAGAGAALDEALEVASKARDDQRVADISVARVFFVGAKQQDLRAALALVGAARAAVAQAGGDPGMRAALHMDVGVVYDLAGKGAEAEKEYTRALELFRQRGTDTPHEGDVLHDLGALAMNRGDYAAARTRFQQALLLRRKILGAKHPAVADTLVGLGALARRQGHNAEARDDYQQAAAIYRRVYGDDHAKLGAIYNNLAIIDEVEGHLEDALHEHQRALAIRRAVYGDQHPLVAQSLSGLGNTLLALGKPREALARYRESVALRRTAYPAGHPSIAIGLHGLAGALSATGDVAAAVKNRGEALSILERAKADPLDLAEVRFAQARDLWTLDGRRAGARDLARRARNAYAAGGDAAAENLAAVDAWLAAH